LRASPAADMSDNHPQRSTVDDGELLAGVNFIGRPVHGRAVSGTGGKEVASDGVVSPSMKAAPDPEGRLPGSLGLGIRGGCDRRGVRSSG
jgi:hypothetical protein